MSTYGTSMVLHKEGVYRDGRWESDCHLICRTYAHTNAKMEVENWDLCLKDGSWEMGSVLIFFVTEAGNTLAALGNIHEDDSHIL